MVAQSEWVKDPGAVLDYKFDWRASTNGDGSSDWLASGETIVSHVIAAITPVTIPPLVVDSSSEEDTNTSVEVWLSGGLKTTEYLVRCSIVTSASREDTRTMKIKGEER